MNPTRQAGVSRETFKMPTSVVVQLKQPERGNRVVNIFFPLCAVHLVAACTNYPLKKKRRNIRERRVSRIQLWISSRRAIAAFVVSPSEGVSRSAFGRMHGVCSRSGTGEERAEKCQEGLGEAMAKGQRRQAGLAAADLAGSAARSIQIWMKNH